VADLSQDGVRDLRLSAVGVGTRPVEFPEAADRLWVIHCRTGDEAKRVEVARTVGGQFVARDLSAGPRIKATQLNKSKFERLALDWSRYRGAYRRPATIRAGDAVDVPTPFVHGWFLVDEGLLGERFNGGRRAEVAPAVRELARESFRLRLPRKYDGALAAGVLIWVDARPEADLPQELFAAADEGQFILACPRNAPNQRPVADRYQVALDALACVERSFLIDPRRVYVSGFSGGGQISTHLWACMPDVFTGAVPTVALASYQNVIVGPGKMWQGTIGKPTPGLLKQVGGHRCAAVTGNADFNHDIILEVAKLWTADGLAMRVFDYPGLGHEVPSADQMREAIAWVDEPYEAVRAAEVARASAILAGAGRADVERLIEATRVAPWSEPAWRACELLGVPRP
jgi:predicted esterase